MFSVSDRSVVAQDVVSLDDFSDGREAPVAIQEPFAELNASEFVELDSYGDKAMKGTIVASEVARAELLIPTFGTKVSSSGIPEDKWKAARETGIWISEVEISVAELRTNYFLFRVDGKISGGKLDDPTLVPVLTQIGDRGKVISSRGVIRQAKGQGATFTVIAHHYRFAENAFVTLHNPDRSWVMYRHQVGGKLVEKQVAFKADIESLNALHEIQDLEAIEKEALAKAERKNRKEVKAKIVKMNLRKWTSKNGKNVIEAEFVLYEQGVLTLRKKDETTIEVLLAKLSDEDRKFVQSELKRIKASKEGDKSKGK